MAVRKHWLNNQSIFLTWYLKGCMVLLSLTAKTKINKLFTDATFLVQVGDAFVSWMTKRQASEPFICFFFLQRFLQQIFQNHIGYSYIMWGSLCKISSVSKFRVFVELLGFFTSYAGGLLIPCISSVKTSFTVFLSILSVLTLVHSSSSISWWQMD